MVYINKNFHLRSTEQKLRKMMSSSNFVLNYFKKDLQYGGKPKLSLYWFIIEKSDDVTASNIIHRRRHFVKIINMLPKFQNRITALDCSLKFSLAVRLKVNELYITVLKI